MHLAMSSTTQRRQPLLLVAPGWRHPAPPCCAPQVLPHHACHVRVLLPSNNNKIGESSPAVMFRDCCSRPRGQNITPAASNDVSKQRGGEGQQFARRQQRCCSQNPALCNRWHTRITMCDGGTCCTWASIERKQTVLHTQRPCLSTYQLSSAHAAQPPSTLPWMVTGTTHTTFLSTYLSAPGPCPRPHPYAPRRQKSLNPSRYLCTPAAPARLLACQEVKACRHPERPRQAAPLRSLQHVILRVLLLCSAVHGGNGNG